MTPGATAPGALHRAAVRVFGRGGDFLGSGFYVARGLVATAAHVVAEAGPEVEVGDWTGGRTMRPVTVRAVPERSGGGRFHPYPDLALLGVEGDDGHPVAPLAPHDPPERTEVTAYGFSADSPGDGVQPDTLSLRVAGPSADFLRVVDDRVRPGFSGSMLADRDGFVVGVLKGSRSYADVQGGWFTPVSALRALLDPSAAPPKGGPAVAPGTAEVVEALMTFPVLARPEGRYDLLDRMGGHLGLPYSFEAGERRCRPWQSTSAAPGARPPSTWRRPSAGWTGSSAAAPPTRTAWRPCSPGRGWRPVRRRPRRRTPAPARWRTG